MDACFKTCFKLQKHDTIPLLRQLALQKHDDSVKFDNLSYSKVIQGNLRVMDMTAITLCQENNIPIKVFNIKSSGNLYEIVMGSNIGTTIGK